MAIELALLTNDKVKLLSEEEIEQLQKENEKYISGELMTANQVKSFEETTKKYYIHKDKIKEKIVDLKVSQENTENDNLDRKYQYQIDVLEELLKGETK